MDMAPDMHAEDLISQGNGILRGLSQELGQLETPAAVVTRDILAEGAGALAVDILGMKKARRVGKKATRAFLAGKVSENRRTIMTKYEELFAAWESDIIRFLCQVSTSAPGVTAPGNSDKLVKRVKRSDRYKRLETRVQHIVIELKSTKAEGLVYNSNLPQASPKSVRTEPSPDAAKLLKDLEVSLRRFIERELSKVGKDWWQRVPLEIRNNAERRKLRSESMWPWYPPTSTNVVDYLDFSDYHRIILEEDNWQKAFVKFLKKRSFIEVRLGELDPIRNDIAHSRPVTSSAVAKLRMFSTELLDCMKSA
ncbi:MAG: Swt1 family HEPN domain-containing protein [Chloroflexi bacterium]|nr:Swt1 family HEPN domain-containing protein [Chloroflexota bacterium]